MTAGPADGVPGSGIRHVLFDADGVIQTIPGGWYTAMEPYVGERAQEFLHGTNQERHRAAHMRVALGYDALFDVSCYSCELGLAKPDPAFFAAAARRIGADPSSILFIDDSPRNVDGARAAGLPAEQWEQEQGHEALIALLAGHGVIAHPGKPVR